MAVTFEFTGDNKELSRVLDRTRRQLEALNRQNKKLRDESKRSSQEGVKGFDAMKRSVAGAVTGLLTMGAAISTIRTGLQFVRHEAEKSLFSIKALAEARIRLVQIASSSEDLRSLNLQADRLSATSGVDRGKVRNLLFAARSEGFEKLVPQLLRSANVIDPSAAGGIAGQVPALFQGKVTPAESVNLVGVGAQRSRLNIETLAEALPGAAEGAALTGTSAEETIATAAVFASRFKSGRTAADRIKALGTRLGISEGFGGKGLSGGIAALDAAGPDATKKFLGESQELNVAFRVFKQESAKIGALTDLLIRERSLVGTPGSFLNRQAAIQRAGDPALTQFRQLEAAQSRTQTAREGALAGNEVLIQVARENVRARLLETGATGLRRAHAEAEMATDIFIGAAGGPVQSSQLMAEEIGRLRAEAERQTNVLQSIEGNQRRGNVANPEQ